MDLLKLLVLMMSSTVMAEEVILVYVQDTVILNGREVPAHADMSGMIPVIKINKDYLECFGHEYKHTQEGAWHEDIANNQCD